METIKANNYQNALKEVKALDESLVDRVNENIKHSDRKHNHVLTVKVEDRPGEAKNKVVVNTSILNDASFNKFKKNFKFLGYAKIIVLHDASQHEDVVENDDKKNNSGTNDETKKNNTGTDNGTNDNTGDKVVPNPTDLDTVDSMKAFAKDNDIDLSGLKLKDDIKSALLTWYNEQNQSK